MNSGKVYDTLKSKLNNDIIKIIQKYNIVNVKRQYNLVKYNIRRINITNKKFTYGCKFFYCFICDVIDWDPSFEYLQNTWLNYNFGLFYKDIKYIVGNSSFCVSCFKRFEKKFEVLKQINCRKLIL
jgi:hypothetical protein